MNLMDFPRKPLKWGKMWFLGHFNPQTPENHPKYHPETMDFTAVFMVWRAGAPPGPLLAPKWGKMVNFNEFNGFWGILPPKHLKTTPNTTPKRLISLLFSWSGAPGPPQAPFWRPNGEKCGFWGILTPKHLQTTLFTPLTPSGAEIPI